MDMERERERKERCNKKQSGVRAKGREGREGSVTIHNWHEDDLIVGEKGVMEEGIPTGFSVRPSQRRGADHTSWKTLKIIKTSMLKLINADPLGKCGSGCDER